MSPRKSSSTNKPSPACWTPDRPSFAGEGQHGSADLDLPQRIAVAAGPADAEDLQIAGGRRGERLVVGPPVAVVDGPHDGPPVAVDAGFNVVPRRVLGLPQQLDRAHAPE